MDEAARRIMEMKIEEAIAWHDGKMADLIHRYQGVGIGTPGHDALDRANTQLYRMIRESVGIDD